MKQAQLTATTTENISKLKQMFRTIEGILSEAYFMFEEDGIVIQGADPAMVGLMRIKIKEEYFDKYELEEEFDSAFNVEELYNSFKAGNNEEELVIKYGEGDEEEYLLTEIHNEEHNFTIRSGHNYLNLIKDEMPSIDGLDDYTCKFQVPTSQMKRFLKNIKSRGDGVTVEATQEAIDIDVSVSSRSNYQEISARFDNMTYEFFDEKTKSKFSIDYLYKLFAGRKISSIADRVHMKLGNDFPMATSFENENFAFKFILAPRIEEE